jgi:hypothetical protein
MFPPISRWIPIASPFVIFGTVIPAMRTTGQIGAPSGRYALSPAVFFFFPASP